MNQKHSTGRPIAIEMQWSKQSSFSTRKLVGGRSVLPLTVVFAVFPGIAATSLSL
jgi:hypothetical protein